MSESIMTIDIFGTKIWRNSAGQTHRDDGPAVEHTPKRVSWYQNGKQHHIDDPDVERPVGTKVWYQNGVPHRVDGPAMENEDGSVGWIIQGVYLGHNIEGFWRFWDRLNDEDRQNVNLHMWLSKLTNV